MTQPWLSLCCPIMVLLDAVPLQASSHARKHFCLTSHHVYPPSVTHPWESLWLPGGPAILLSEDPIALLFEDPIILLFEDPIAWFEDPIMFPFAFALAPTIAVTLAPAGASTEQGSSHVRRHLFFSWHQTYPPPSWQPCWSVPPPTLPGAAPPGPGVMGLMLKGGPMLAGPDIPMFAFEFMAPSSGIRLLLAFAFAPSISGALADGQGVSHGRTHVLRASHQEYPPPVTHP